MTASSRLLWMGNMTLRMISDLLRRYRCVPTWATERPSSVGISEAHWKYRAQTKVIKYTFLKAFWGMCYCNSFPCFLHTVIQWYLYSSFLSGVWKRNNGSGKTIDAGAIVEVGFAQGP
jgi:hypothetical protein